jgi:hypothetical protein
MKKLLYILLLISLSANAATYYVSPSGNDSNAGTLAAPWLNWNYSFNRLIAGDVLYIRGGNYTVMGSANQAVTISNKNGTAGNLISVFNYMGEVPILVCSSLTGSGEHYGILINNSSFWHFKGITIKSVREYNNGATWAKGFEISSGSHDLLLEQISVTDCGGGFTFGGSTAMTNISFLNCDSFFNYDRVDGGGYCNGFSANVPSGSSITYTGCRAWSNSDDGFDFYGGEGVFVLKNCWAWRNGWDVPTSGDGAGYKFGLSIIGNGSRTVLNCISAFNKLIGFDESADNGSTTPMFLYNCISYSNVNDCGFHFTVPGGTAFTTLRNNISYLSYPGRDYEGRARNVQDHNTWNGIAVSNNDFVSTDYTQMAGARVNGELPLITFLHLKSTSGLIDKGVDVGLPYSGSAPDLGAFEYSSTPVIDKYLIMINNSIVKF